MDFSLAVLSNTEGEGQGGVMEAVCILYNMARDALNGQSYRTCTFVPGDYYRGGCKCDGP